MLKFPAFEVGRRTYIELLVEETLDEIMMRTKKRTSSTSKHLNVVVLGHVGVGKSGATNNYISLCY